MDLEWNRRPIAEGKRIIKTIDAHAAGEPLRIVVSGLPDIPGDTILQRRGWMQAHKDDLRKVLMWEPRGHHEMYGCVVVPPVSQEADLGVLFLHNAGYSTMCGHGVIALVTVLLESGALPTVGEQTPVPLDTPAGTVRATAHVESGGRVSRVSFVNVPSFVLTQGTPIEVPGVGTLAVDVAFGGAFYAVVPAASVGLTVEPSLTRRLVEMADAITRAVQRSLPIDHPEDPDLGFLYGTILTGPPANSRHHSRNICVFADREVDRSPTGTGVSARLALLADRHEIAEGQTIHIESVLGAESAFSGRVVGRGRVGEYEAIVPEVGGSAFITGVHEFILDEHDALGAGFLVQ